MKSHYIAVLLAMAIHIAATEAAEPSRYMGGPVELTKAPNGAVTDKELLGRLGDFNWLQPTIENPVKGIYVLGGYSLAPMAVIETDEGAYCL
jgi:linear primary-alkylsulfatase